MKRIMSILVSVFICFTMLSQFTAFADNTYIINGKTIPLEGYEIGKAWDNCWTFARNVYQEIWQTNTGINILKDESDLAITAENTKRFIQSADLGSNIRVEDGKDINKHSLILIQKDDKGFTVYHGNYGGEIAITYYTYEEFANHYAAYKYFAYITNPNMIKIILNGNEVYFDQPPILVNNRTLVPMRAVFEALGAKVDWNGDTHTITATRGDTIITMKIRSSLMYKNDEQITLEASPDILNDRTIIPVRAVTEAFGCNVDWNGNTQTITITE